MSRTLKILATVATVLVVAAIVLGQVFGARFFTDPAGTYRWQAFSAGQKALFMCSAVFTAGRKPDDVLRWEIGYASPMFNAPGDAKVDMASRSAVGSTAMGFIKRRAVFREGGGCSLLAPGSIETAATLAQTLARTDEKVTPEELQSQRAKPWPEGDVVGVTEPAGIDRAGIDRARLDAVVAAAFDGRTYYEPGSPMPDTKTIGVVVVYQGQIVAERYSDGWNQHTQARTYSAAKSFTNLMAGSRVLEGKLDIDAPLLLPEWRAGDDPRRAITTRHVLNMSSGLDCDRAGTLTLSTYFGGGANAAVNSALRSVVEAPGTLWCYSNFDAISVALAVGQTFQERAEYLSYPYKVLHRIGMYDTYPETDVHGNFIMSSQIWTTPRDLARFGLLYLHDGVWNGQRLLPEGWVAFTREPAPATRSMEKPPGYGAQFWLYNDHPRLPADTFTAAGHGGQFSTIVPSRDVVITRMGLQEWKHKEFVADVLAALPASAPSAPANGEHTP